MATYTSTGDGWYQLAQLKAQEQYQQQQQAYNNLQQQLASPMYIYQSGLTAPYTTATQATLSTTFSNWAQDVYAKAKIKFWRVNQIVEMDEGGEMIDPLDNLRLKVARWLRPKEKYNFA